MCGRVRGWKTGGGGWFLKGRAQCYIQMYICLNNSQWVLGLQVGVLDIEISMKYLRTLMIT